MPTEYFEQRERALLGPRYEQLYAAPQEAAERGVTVSALRAMPEQFAQKADFPLEVSPFCKAAFVVHAPEFKPGRHPYHHAGVFYSQEPSASSAAPLLGVQPGMRVLDLCAAPGGKSSQLAAALQGRGVLVSNEYVAARAEILKSNLERMGVPNAVVLNETPARIAEALPEFFDRVLVDAPCSGEGMFRKEPVARQQHCEALVKQCAELGAQILDCAAAALAPGGQLVYSTCTLNREENQSVIEWLLSRYPQAVEILPLGELFPGAADALTAEGFLHVFPQIYDCEGFFVARLRKTAAIDPLPAPGYKVGKFPFTPLKDREAAAVTAAARAVGLEWDAGHTLWQRDKELWLFPLALEPLFGKVRFSRIGVRLAELHNKGYRWQHEAVIAFAAPQRAFELSQEEAEEWYRGRDVYPQTAPGQDETIVTFQGVPLGLAKRVGSRLKNSYPRELVRDGKLFAGKV